MRSVSPTLPSAPPPTPEPQLDTYLSEISQKPWVLGYVPATEFESSTSKWSQITSMPWIHVGERVDSGKSYEIAVDPSWLSFHGLVLNLDYNPTQPTEGEIRVHGSWEATTKAQARFVRNAVYTIRTECSRGHEECYRGLAESNNLTTPLERAILNLDILESDPRVRKYLTQRLVFLGLNLLGNYNSSYALELLEKNEDDLLEPFRNGHRNLLKRQTKISEGLEVQTIYLLRNLLEFCGHTPVEHRQYAFNPEYTASGNANLYGLLIGITGTNEFGHFDTEQMRNALLNSNLFTEDPDISFSDPVEWSEYMMEFLPIGFPKGHLHIPRQVLSRLGFGQVDLFFMHIEQIYQQRPSLRKPENNVLLLFTWSLMVHGLPLQALSEWVRSSDGVALYQRMVEDFQISQEPEQLALTLSALLCWGRLFLCNRNDIVGPTNGSYLDDLDAILNGQSLSNRWIVFERISFSFLRVLDTLGGEYKDISRFMAVALLKKAPLLDPFDGFSDQYLVRRIQSRFNHKIAFELTEPLHLMLQSSVDNGTEWVLVSSHL